MLMHYRTAELHHLTFVDFFFILGGKPPQSYKKSPLQTMRQKVLSSAVTGLGSFLSEESESEDL